MWMQDQLCTIEKILLSAFLMGNVSVRAHLTLILWTTLSDTPSLDLIHIIPSPVFSLSICAVLYNSEKRYSKCCYVFALQISPQGTSLFSSILLPNVLLPHPTAPPRAKVGDCPLLWVFSSSSLGSRVPSSYHGETLLTFSPLSDSIFNTGIFCSHNFSQTL